MKTMTSVEAKNKFGFLVDTSQREPVVITRHDRPVSIMISVEDAKNTLITDLYSEKEDGYEEWFSTRVKKTLKGVNNGSIPTIKHDEVVSEVSKLFK